MVEHYPSTRSVQTIDKGADLCRGGLQLEHQMVVHNRTCEAGDVVGDRIAVHQVEPNTNNAVLTCNNRNIFNCTNASDHTETVWVGFERIEHNPVISSVNTGWNQYSACNLVRVYDIKQCV